LVQIERCTLLILEGAIVKFKLGYLCAAAVALASVAPCALAQATREKPARPKDLIVVETVMSPLQPNIVVAKTAAATTATAVVSSATATVSASGKTEAEITTQTINNAAAKEATTIAEATRAGANMSGTIIDEFREKGQPTGLRVNTGFSQYDLNGTKATSRVPGFGPVKPVSVPMWSVFGW
jgi:hypothetical protein